MRDTAGTATGLRERKKERTREALVDAAQELFLRKGYDATTIDEIVAAVEVSRRTFFRYFAGKEEVALARAMEFEALFLDALTTRPADEAPLTALRRAGTEVFARVVDEEHDGAGQEFLRMRRMIEDTPVLLAASLRNMIELERRMAAEIARREGLTPGADRRPALLVTLYHSVMRVAMDEWTEGGALEATGLVRIIEDAWDDMGVVLTGRWTADEIPRA
ncbi:TetR/AcrR family transcriptional regulator [Embleya scabrispora]|uniref:TetR/AcrR family transcriptional regulator n=1 Tax=Embleya scabrispora TaxID=159449 RepID=UPI0003645FE2|nr:TetR family transcriptional regulator [Embleya scabrispora]MYS79035.1 TetR family transcriptional regulator [Streptomyces sp. SID5474]